jgi:thioredoxin 2
VVQEVARELAGQAAVVQVNTEESPHLAQRFSIRGIPALLIIRQGRVLDSLSGFREKSVLLAWFDRVTRQKH